MSDLRFSLLINLVIFVNLLFNPLQIVAIPFELYSVVTQSPSVVDSGYLGFFGFQLITYILGTFLTLYSLNLASKKFKQMKYLANLFLLPAIILTSVLVTTVMQERNQHPVGNLFIVAWGFFILVALFYYQKVKTKIISKLK